MERRPRNRRIRALLPVMSVVWADLAGLAIGTMAIPLVGWLPGLALLRGLERLGFDSGSGWSRAGWAGLLALALLPALDALVVRFAGLGLATLVHLLLALAAVVSIAAHLRHNSFPRLPRLVLLLPLWWLIVAVAYVDYGPPGALHQSLLVLDLVKHAAVVETINRTGLPLADPFFLRDGVSGYYYYFYIGPAMVRWLAGGLVDGRMAFAAAAFWAGPAFVAGLWRIAADAGLIALGQGRRIFAILAGLCFVSGADLPFMLLRAHANKVMQPQVEWWSEEIRFALGSLLWVPHHVIALIACWLAALLLVRSRGAPPRLALWLVLLSGLALASGFGMSAWVTIAAVPVFAAWLATQFRTDPKLALACAAAGTLALLVDAGQIADLLAGRAREGFPLALSVRGFADILPTNSFGNTLLLVALLPIGYLIGFGVFARGAAAFFRMRRSTRHNPVATLLVVSALVSLVEAGFLRSTIINNDFGWRAIWFAELPAIIWTGIAVGRYATFTALPGLMRLLIAFGLAANVWDVAGLRFIRPPVVFTGWGDINPDPALDAQGRRAYRWASTHLPADAVLQANPAAARRVFDFGLYGTHRTAVADREAMLFGAARADVAARIAWLRPVFEQALPLPDLAARASREGIDALLLTEADPAWRRNGGPPAGLPCAYREARICLALIKDFAR